MSGSPTVAKRAFGFSLDGAEHFAACVAEMKGHNVIKGIVSGGNGDRLQAALTWHDNDPSRFFLIFPGLPRALAGHVQWWEEEDRIRLGSPRPASFLAFGGAQLLRKSLHSVMRKMRADQLADLVNIAARLTLIPERELD